VTSGVKEVREILDEAKRRSRSGLRTLLFMDEVHRFNKAQQDAFLPSIESGDVTFIGATTENPSFELNPALLSRCKVLTLNKIQPEIIERLLKRALSDTEKGVMAGLHEEDPSFVRGVQAEEDALAFLSQAADGDARAALNALEIAVASAVSREKQHLAFNESSTGKDSCDVKGEALKQNDVSLAASDPTQPSELAGSGGAAGIVTIRLADVSEALQRSHILYDKKGEEHYNIISALHKSMRGGDPDAALYWLARMLEGGEGPLYIARRLVRFASEDIGLADLQALTLAVACYQSCHFLGMPECNVHLAQCVAYLALAPKSVAVYQAINEAQEWVKKRGNEPVPLHLRNAPTGLMRQLGYGRGYIYPPNCEGPVEQDYFPPSLRGHKFLKWP
jgi:putative ATPase